MLQYDAKEHSWAAGKFWEFEGKEMQLHAGRSDVLALMCRSKRAAGY